MGIDLGITALASSLATQSIMTQLLVKTLAQTQQLVELTGDITLAPPPDAAQIEGLGENVDLYA